ncbi:MAG: dihydroneopterin aldolase [Bacteroidia bacterium]
MEQVISIEGIECYAYHGCLEEEGIIGGNYTVDVYIWADVSKALKSDDLKDTVDYTMVHDAVRKEMAIRSKLIEHVANRILENISSQIKAFIKISVRVTKHNPPVNGQVNKTSFVLSLP